jgi:hypothetical protein
LRNSAALIFTIGAFLTLMRAIMVPPHNLIHITSPIIRKKHKNRRKALPSAESNYKTGHIAVMRFQSDYDPDERLRTILNLKYALL